MPIPVTEALADSEDAAATKAAQATDLPRYLVSSALAGAYVGVAVVLLLSIGGPLVAAGSGFAKLAQGAVFGIALTLVVFAGAELFTGNVMVMLQGLMARRIRPVQLLGVWVASLAGNLAGAIAFAWLVHAGGTLDAGAAPAKAGPARALLQSILDNKVAASGGQLFARAVLCNMLVCLALWMAMRTRSDGAKLSVLWWALLAFIASGFEHSIANMTLFALGALDGQVAWSELLRNLAWTVPGNIVGGGVLVGVAYGWLGRPAAASSSPLPAPATPTHQPVPASAVGVAVAASSSR